MEKLRAALEVIEAFRAVDTAMPSGYMAAFLQVAINPGQSVSTYAPELGMVTPVASRVLLEIGKKTRTGGVGMELVDSQQSAQDLRFVQYFVTTKGRALVAKIIRAIERVAR